jgi:hypothetical protein
MIDREHDLAIGRQAELLHLSRSSLYYEPRPVSSTILALMRRIDELHLNYPFAGSRMLRDRFCQFSRHLDPVGLWAGRAAYAACIMPSATPAALVKRERRALAETGWL